MNGYEATAAIRAMEGGARRTPILAMTAGVRPEERQRCLDAGMDGYLAKPVNKALLLAKVARVLAPGTTRSNGSARTEPAALPSSRVSAVDAGVLAELRALSEDADPGFLPDLVSQFLADTDARMERLACALDAGDARSAGVIAHSIKGSSAALGGRALALSCGRLEKALDVDPAAGRGALGEMADEYESLRQALARELLTPA
jgi:CheY-like chemotaxis protein